jgi:hypothetical protein
MDSTQPKPFVFVLMPFDKKFDDVYKFGIKEACKGAGAYSERLDEQIFAESMLDRIYVQINKADLLIADMTGRNPNVFYEVGYAHALGKRVILLTQETGDIPFDLQHRQHIVYGGSIATLQEELTKHVSFELEQLASRVQSSGSIANLECYIGGEPIPYSGEIEVVAIASGDGQYLLAELKDLTIHNPTNRALDFQHGIGLVVFEKKVRTENSIGTLMTLPNDAVMTELVHVGGEIGPGAWSQLDIQVEVRGRTGNGFRAALRFFRSTGPEDFDFTVNPIDVPF